MPCKTPQKGSYFMDYWSLVCFEIGSYLALNFRVLSSFLIGCSESKLHRSDAVHKWYQPILHIYGTQNKAIKPRGPSELKQIMGQSVENPMWYHGEWSRYYFGVFFYHQMVMNNPAKSCQNFAKKVWNRKCSTAHMIHLSQVNQTKYYTYSTDYFWSSLLLI